MLRPCCASPFPWRGELGLSRLTVGHLEENPASGAVIRACGGRAPEQVVQPDGRRVYRYTILL